MILHRRAVLGGLALALAAPGLAATAGLRRSRNRLFAPALVGGRRLEALLDSGAEMTVLDHRIAARLGIARRQAARGVGSGGTFRAYLTDAVPLVVAGVDLGRQRLAVTDLADISRRLIGSPLAMIAGRQVFDAGRFELDTAAPFLRRVARTGAPRGVAVPLTPRRGIETLPVVIEGQRFTADLDIGNGNEVLVHARAARALGWLGDGRNIETVGGAGGLGGAVNRRLTVARSITVAGRTFTDVAVGIDDQPTGADANLSTSFLDAFRLTLDYPQKRVWFLSR